MKKIVTGTQVSIKDETGAYVPSHLAAAKEEPTLAPVSIDDLLNAGLQNISGAMRAVTQDIGTGMPSRETIQNLKDLMQMLKELKKDERDLIDSMSDEQLEKMLKK